MGFIKNKKIKKKTLGRKCFQLLSPKVQFNQSRQLIQQRESQVYLEGVQYIHLKICILLFENMYENRCK